MATLRTIKKRIGAVASTKKLTRAMRMIAASRLAKAQGEVMAARVFNKELGRIFSEIAKRNTISHPLFSFKEGAANKTDLVVISSDRGLCGAFNERLLKEVENYAAKRRDSEIIYSVFGKKGRDYFKRRGLRIDREFIHLINIDREKMLEDELVRFVDRFTRGVVKEVVVAYNRFKHAGSQEVSFLTLLPSRQEDLKQEYGIDYIYEPTKNGVIDWLVKNIVRVNLKTAFLESVTSELSARMLAMDMATKNAEDLIGALTVKYNRARQASITKELIDIVGAAEAMK